MGNSLYLGSAAVDSVYLGSTKADKVYLGSTLVWSASVTTTATVATTADDGYSLSGSLAIGDGILISAGATNLRGFARFTNVTIPPGATIVSATLGISSFSYARGTVACHVCAVAADNPAQPSGSSIDTATLTTATVDWSATGVTAAPVTSPDIASVIQEIVNRPGWASGNSLILVATYTVTTATANQVSGADLSETLTVTYS